MDFGFTEEQDMLRQSARDFLAAECPISYVRKMMDDDQGYSEDSWKKMAGLGWTGLIIPEEFGGIGLDMVDLIVVLEEMGRAMTPGPFYPTVVLGGQAIALGGSAEQKRRFLPDLAAGDSKATLALVEEGKKS